MQKSVMRQKIVWLCVVFLASAGRAAQEKKMDDGVEKASAGFTLTSPSFKHLDKIPKLHTGDGKDRSPALQWSGAPQDAKSFALIMDDPDAPPGTWVHWVLYDIPGHIKELSQGLPKKEGVLGSAKHGLCWGVSEFERVGYYGPMPPPGAPHRYFFKLYALDKELGLKPRATKDELLKAMEGRVLASTELMGTYQR